MRISNLALLLLCLVVVQTACAPSGNSDNEQKSDAKQVVTGFGDVNEQLKQVYYRFPTPDEMFSYVQTNELTFDPTITYKLRPSQNIIESKNQKLLLGIYLADLAYITLFERYKESMDYLRQIHALSDKIRISGAFDQPFIDRLEDNLKNADSLRIISGEALDRLINYLSANQMEETFSLISIGAFTEVLYISTNLVDSYTENDPTINRIAEQKYVLRNLYEYVTSYRSDKDVYEAIEQIEGIIEIFNSLEVVEHKTTVSKNKDGKVVLEGGSKVNLTEEQYKVLKQETQKVRNSIISE